jgi:antirestriction protein ArdC
MEQNKADIYGRITSHVIEAIVAGAGAYRMPWHVTDADTFAPTNAASGRPYRGVNVLSLWSAAAVRGYASGLWATYRQWCALGAQVRRDAKATPVVFWNITDKAGREVADHAIGRMPARDRLFLARGYSVFNAAQVDGFFPRPHRAPDEESGATPAEAFFRRLGPNVRHGGSSACYLPGVDLILMPRFESFREPAAYYSTLAQEATRWTGAPHRLNRDLKLKYASEGYAMEELVAELGAAFLCASLKIPVTPRPDHAAYIAGWLEVLRRDRRAVFAAASQAQRAADWMTKRAGLPATAAA